MGGGGYRFSYWYGFSKSATKETNGEKEWNCLSPRVIYMPGPQDRRSPAGVAAAILGLGMGDCKGGKSIFNIET